MISILHWRFSYKSLRSLSYVIQRKLCFVVIIRYPRKHPGSSRLKSSLRTVESSIWLRAATAILIARLTAITNSTVFKWRWLWRPFETENLWRRRTEKSAVSNIPSFHLSKSSKSYFKIQFKKKSIYKKRDFFFLQQHFTRKKYK